MIHFKIVCFISFQFSTFFVVCKKEKLLKHKTMIVIPIICISAIGLLGFVTKKLTDRHHRKKFDLIEHNKVILMINGTEYTFPYEKDKAKRLQLAMNFCSAQGRQDICINIASINISIKYYQC